MPVTEPTFTASTPVSGTSVRMVIYLDNGQSLSGYAGAALTGP